MAIATFNYNNFIAAYPAFRKVGSGAMENAFNLATGLWRNDGTGPCIDEARQTQILYLLSAHIAQLMGLLNCDPTGPTPGPVGRLSSASEGSVSASFEFPTNPGQAWFAQTAYGALYWQLTAAYRTMRYIPGYPRNFEPVRGFPALFPGRGRFIP